MKLNGRWTYTNRCSTNAIGRFEMEFGPEIKIPVNGVKPDFINDDDMVSFCGVTGAARTWCFDGEGGVYRLPANHPHYQPTPIRTPLEDRMVALVKAVAAPNQVDIYKWQIEARAILAKMEPAVDEDLLEARMIALKFALPGKNGFSTYATNRGDADNGDEVQAVLQAIKRGRQLEKEGK